MIEALIINFDGSFILITGAQIWMCVSKKQILTGKKR